MSVIRHDFGGITDGASLTSGSGGNTVTAGNNFFNSISANAPTAATSAAYEGPRGMRCNTPTTTLCSATWVASLGNIVDFYSRFFFRFTANPSNFSNAQMIRFFGAGGSGAQGGVSWGRTTTNFISILNTLAGTVATATTVPVANTWYRMEVFIHSDVATGYITLRIYSDPTAPSGSAGSGTYEELNALGAAGTWAMASATTGEVDFGVLGASHFPSDTEYVHIDHVNAGQTTGWYGPLTPGFTNTGVPTVAGNLSVGGTLAITAGTWVPTPSSFNYYWHREDDALGTNLVEIGATGATYTLDSADLNKYIRAGVIPVP